MSDTAQSKLSILRCALTGVAVLVVQFVICWAAAGFVPASHMYISIFTAEPVGSLNALAVGLSTSILFGGLTGALVAIAYNAFGFVQGRRAIGGRTAQA